MQGGKIVSKGKDPGGGETEEKPELVQPDGGWGWMVVFAYALCFVIVVPILQSFGLLYRETFENLEISTTNATVVVNVNSAFGMIFGLFSGFLLRRFGYRKIGFIAAIINSVGIILTSQADSFAYFLITYGMISSVGFNLLMSSFNLALNTYFKERRGKAMGFATTAMGLGPVAMPLIISKLMSVYGVSGTALILGGLSMHSIAAALLLHPIKWHMVPKKLTSENVENGEEDDEDETEKLKTCHTDEPTTKRRRTITTSSVDHDIDAHSVYGFETPIMEHRKLARRRVSIASFKRSTSHMDDGPLRHSSADKKWWTSTASVNTVNLGSSMKIFDEKTYQPLREVDDNGVHSDQKKDATKRKENENKTGNSALLNGTSCNKNNLVHASKDSTPLKINENEEPEEEKEEQLSFWQRVGRAIVDFFDLGLLKDPIYVNLMIGMSLAICAEYNFSILTPFILDDRGFETERIAIIMSIIGGLDIVFRFLAPFFSDYYKIHPQHMYLIALTMLVISRTTMIFSESFESMIPVAVALGVAKGVRTVYMGIVIPSYVPLERLASASALQMVVNGVLLMVFGPMIGKIRDVSGSYKLCIGFINMLTGVTLIMWTTQILVVLYRRKHQQNAD